MNSELQLQIDDTPKARIDAIALLNPDRINKTQRQVRIQYIDIGNVNEGYISEFQYLALDNAPSRAQRKVKSQDIILSTVRPGNRAFVFLKDPPENMVVSTGFTVIRATKCHPRYLYYALTCDSVIDYLASIADDKSAYPSINPKDIGELEIPLPPLETQKEIAHILGTLDDKIELNRRMNKTLEEIAQALFKHWFIDFEFPNEEGKPYKSSGGEMVDSELGPIPKGWRAGKIGDLCSFEYGKALKSERRKDGNIPVLGSNGQIGWHDKALAKGPGVVVGRKGNPGNVKRINTDFYPIDTTFYVIPATDCIPIVYLYYVLLYSSLSNLNSDSAVPGLNRAAAMAQICLIPSMNLPLLYYDNILSIIQKIHKNDSYNLNLNLIKILLMKEII